jgi:hypothetical protein
MGCRLGIEENTMARIKLGRVQRIKVYLVVSCGYR